MAQITDSTTSYKQHERPRTLPPRSGCILGCFGGSRGGSPENEQSLEEGEKNRKRKVHTWWLFSWSILKKESTPRKTVPIDGTTDEKHQTKKGRIFLIKSSKKHQKDQTPKPLTGKIVHGKPNKTKYDNVQEINLENSKSMNQQDCMNKSTYKKGLSTISKCTSSESISSPTSPDNKCEVSRGMMALSHSISMPPPTRKRTVSISGGDFKVNKEEKTSQIITNGSGFDQFAGIIIIMFTLIILVFWGKLCAILCTSAWFYYYPLVRGKNEPKDGEGNGPKSTHKLDFNSGEYKKKVVLEGFLERSHRIH